MAEDRNDPIEDAETPEADRLDQERDVTTPDAPVPPAEEAPPLPTDQRPR